MHNCNAHTTKSKLRRTSYANLTPLSAVSSIYINIIHEGRGKEGSGEGFYWVWRRMYVWKNVSPDKVLNAKNIVIKLYSAVFKWKLPERESVQAWWTAFVFDSDRRFSKPLHIIIISHTGHTCTYPWYWYVGRSLKICIIWLVNVALHWVL